jgi:mono/diheme cytochrome c family protein
MTVGRATRCLATLIAFPAALAAQTVRYSFDDSQVFLKGRCQVCHQGTTAAGGFDIQQIASPATLRSETARWTKVALRVRNGEMPPKGAPVPPLVLREQFTNWITASVREAGCAAGAMPSPTRIRRLNRDEYAATIRDLLDIQVDITSSLPADGAGGEGFDNAGETLFLSPLLLEKYIKAAKFAMNVAAKEYKSREKILVAHPGNGVSPEQAAGEILKTFLPRAFRRPLTQDDLPQYVSLFREARKQGLEFEPAILFTVQAVLVSPKFLFLAEPPNSGADLRRIDPYSLATRMSYFLWGSMPDELLFDLAAAGKLHEPAAVRELIPRMLRRDQGLEFAKRFVDQWLRIRQLDTDKAPDAKLFPAWTTDEELRSDIRLQPALFFHEVLKRDLSVLNLIDSTQTIVTRKLGRHLGETIKLTGDAQQPQWADLPKGSTRGGLLGMPAVLAVSSYPYRTSPVLRGAWVLESILGTPPPPPPADVPALEKQASAEGPKSVREMLTQHRASPACASCHNSIDPIGYALENYDFIGRWREEDAGKAIDNHGELPDGTTVAGPQSLKAAVLDRKELFVRNLTAKMLGYALGRGLTLQDSCTVDRIVTELRENDYRAQKLIELIVLSVPFQYQPPAAERPKGAKP